VTLKRSSRDPKRGLLSDEKSDLLRKIMVRYFREAEKCRSVRAYYAACIMIGGAFEAVLLQMCDVFEDEVAEAVLRLPEKQRPKGSIEHWGAVGRSTRVRTNFLDSLPERRGFEPSVPTA